MNKPEITKIVVRNVNSFFVARTISSHIAATAPSFNNPILDASVKVGAFVASYCAAGVVTEPVNKYADEQIDAIFDVLSPNKNKTN